jgi:hypothetical protein
MVETKKLQKETKKLQKETKKLQKDKILGAFAPKITSFYTTKEAFFITEIYCNKINTLNPRR